MKTLDDHMRMPYRMEIIEEIESAIANALDAKKAWIIAALEDGIDI